MSDFKSHFITWEKVFLSFWRSNTSSFRFQSMVLWLQILWYELNDQQNYGLMLTSSGNFPQENTVKHRRIFRQRTSGLSTGIRERKLEMDLGSIMMNAKQIYLNISYRSLTYLRCHLPCPSLVGRDKWNSCHVFNRSKFYFSSHKRDFWRSEKDYGTDLGRARAQNY